MGLIHKIKEAIGLNDSPSLEGTWEIRRVGNPEKFMVFALSQAPNNGTWVLDTVLSEEKIAGNTQLVYKEGKIVLTKASVLELIDLLPELDLNENFIHHMIYNPDESTFLLAYDNFNRVWLSKSITHETISEAAEACDFDFKDPELPEDGSA